MFHDTLPPTGGNRIIRDEAGRAWICQDRVVVVIGHVRYVKGRQIASRRRVKTRGGGSATDCNSCNSLSTCHPQQRSAYINTHTHSHTLTHEHHRSQIESRRTTFSPYLSRSPSPLFPPFHPGALLLKRKSRSIIGGCRRCVRAAASWSTAGHTCVSGRSASSLQSPCQWHHSCACGHSKTCSVRRGR